MHVLLRAMRFNTQKNVSNRKNYYANTTRHFSLCINVYSDLKQQNMSLVILLRGKRKKDTMGTLKTHIQGQNRGSYSKTRKTMKKQPFLLKLRKKSDTEQPELKLKSCVISGDILNVLIHVIWTLIPHLFISS